MFDGHRCTSRGGGRRPVLKNFRANSVFRASASCSKILNDKKYIQYREFRANAVLRARASCSKILNDKKYTVKIFRATLFFKASASCSKTLNDKKYIFNTVNSRHTLFFRASASCSKILDDKKYIQYSGKFHAKLCFPGLSRQTLFSSVFQKLSIQCFQQVNRVPTFGEFDPRLGISTSFGENLGN